jgi:Protein of unknown function (DUF3489)
MRTIAINEKNRIAIFVSKKEAAAASQTPFDTFSNQKELTEVTADWPMQRLIGVWNNIPGVNQVSKFANRKVAIERLWKAIQGLDVTTAKSEASAPAPEIDPEVAESQDVPRAVVEVQQPAEAAVIIEAQQPEATVVEEKATTGKVPGAASRSESVPEAAAQVPETAPVVTPVQRTTRAKKAPKAAAKAKTEKADAGPREGSKTAQVVAMLQREGGATLTEIMEKMGWQRHTVRGFMAGAMKKVGYSVESFKPEGGERSYRISQ